MNILQASNSKKRRKVLTLSVAVAVFSVGLAIMGGLEFNSGSEMDNTDILLITIEDARTDHFGPCYGYRRNTTPGICEIAEDGRLYRNSYNHGTFTLSSLSSIFTSKRQDRLEVTDYSKDRVYPLSEDEKTLAETLSENGYGTAATVYPIKFVKRKFNLDQGFDSYERTSEPSDFQQLNFSNSGKNFQWLHMGWTHCSYLNPPKRFDLWTEPGSSELEPYKCSSTNLSRERLNHTVNKYDGELRRTDFYISELINRMKEKGTYDDTLIVITADHGSNFGEFGYTGHGLRREKLPAFPQESLTNVPLIIKPPEGVEAAEGDSLVSNIDLKPTVLQTARIKPHNSRNILDEGYYRKAVYYPSYSAIRTKKFFYMENPLFFVNRSRNPMETKNHSIDNETRNSLSRKLDSLQRNSSSRIEGKIKDRLIDIGYFR